MTHLPEAELKLMQMKSRSLDVVLLLKGSSVQATVLKPGNSAIAQ